MPRRYLTSRLKMRSMPAMAMKLIRKSFHDSLCLLIRGSKTAVKEQDVAMHATPTETLDAWMLAKKATQWIPSSTPQPAMAAAWAAVTLCRRRARSSIAARVTRAIIDLYQTRGRPAKEMILPNIPVHPARKTAIFSRIRVRVLSFTCYLVRYTTILPFSFPGITFIMRVLVISVPTPMRVRVAVTVGCGLAALEMSSFSVSSPAQRTGP